MTHSVQVRVVIDNEVAIDEVVRVSDARDFPERTALERSEAIAEDLVDSIRSAIEDAQFEVSS